MGLRQVVGVNWLGKLGPKSLQGRFSLFLFCVIGATVACQLLISSVVIERYFMAAVSILVLAWGIRFSKKVIDPIKRLEEQISRISDEDELCKVRVEGPQEIVSLAGAFNIMVDNIRMHREENESLRLLSNQDELTGLYNHRFFYEKFREKMLTGRGEIYLIFCDIDKFRDINNRHGYSSGDLFLRELAGIIKDVVGNRGYAFRYSGEEFAVLLPESCRAEALSAAEEIRRGMNSSRRLKEHSRQMNVTMSVGIAAYPQDSKEAEELIKKAKIGVYYSKQNGRNRCSVYSKDMEETANAGMEEYFKREALLDSVLALTKAIDAKDSYTGEHSDAVARYSLIIAKELYLTERDKSKLKMGALLHDSGKIGVPDSIINKTSRLTDEEYAIIKRHTILGDDIIRNIIKDEKVLACVRSHHERWDGRGYPDGLFGEDIPLYARIVSIADSFHAMISNRAYRRALTIEQALSEMEKNKGTQFDPHLADLFIEAVRRMEGSAVYDEAAASRL